MRIDSKGKYYTQRISTEPLEVLILTDEGVVRGAIHIHPDMRLSDELNQNPAFLPVTEATVTLHNGTTYSSGFLSINKNRVVWVIPVETLEPEA